MGDRALSELVARALAEDVGKRDLTAEATVPADVRARASVIQKQPGVPAGLDAARETFLQAGAAHFEALVEDGRFHHRAPAAVARVSGPGRALLAAERVALNLLGHLSGVATLTAGFVRAVEGTGVRILDTRKTTPGLRTLEKAAVAAGGGENHRMGLDDAILIKENHAALAGGVGEAVSRARQAQPDHPVEAECRDLGEVEAALEAGAARLLLDNMSAAELRGAVRLAREIEPEVELEASGGVTLDNVAAIASTGVDYVSVGALTHSAPALDLSMTLEPG